MKKTKRRVHTYVQHRYLVPGIWHQVLRIIPGIVCVFERKHSAGRHSTAPQGKARHGTASYRAALRAAGLWLS